MHFLDKIYSAFNSKSTEYSLAIFCDLKKAFDTVNFDILLAKLEHYGFRGKELQWFFNYLKGRRQAVEIDGVSSTLKELLCGVPQGSVLGPILFLIFINDLPNCSELFALLFADDTTLQINSENLVSLFSKANEELAKVATWFRCNKLTLNVSKSKYILF